MRHVCMGIMALLLAQGCGLCADDVEELRQKGIQALKESQSHPQAIVEAARCFAKASELYMKAGDDDKAVEMNSFLFWCKKKMSYQDIERFTNSGEKAVTEKLYLVERISPEADDAKKWFDRAEKFASENPEEHLLIAVRFFEVASRFVGGKPSIAAQERSLKELALAMEKATASKETSVVHDPAVVKDPVKNAAEPAPADSNDPLRKRVAAARTKYMAELENARRTVLEALDKREADARKIGNKKAVDQVKDERAAFEGKSTGEQILVFPPENKQKIRVAWRSLAAEYEAAIKEYTKAAKDADADAMDKEYARATEAQTGAAAVNKTAGNGVAAAAGTLRDKTLVAWITLNNLAQRRGSVLSLNNAASSVFDGIVYAELEPERWMAGSEGYARTQREQKTYPQEKSPPNSPIQVAIAYREHDITIYHNGRKYARYAASAAPVAFDADAFVLFGIRHMDVAHECFSGAIADARIYAEALSEDQIAALRPRVASNPAPWAWWTFEDGTCNDRMGRFAKGKPAAGATIQNGLMVLNGKGYFKAELVQRKK